MTGPNPSSGTLSFVGTATCLLECAGMRVLTDPNFLHRGQRAWLGHGLVSTRLTDPAWEPEELTPIDAVVLSHLHGDHWDRESRRRLPRSTPIVTTRHASRRLQTRHGFPRAIGLATWESHTLAGPDGATCTVTALPGRHALGPVERLLPPVMGSLLEFRAPGGRTAARIYLSGDTLVFDGLRAIREHVGEVDRAVLHLGGTTLPGGMMVTMDGRQGADALEIVAPRRATPVHYDDYTVFRSPLADFVAEVERRGWADRVDLVARGDTIPL
ncbi:MBL fold metallo-hydrolase [Actinomycetospora sp. OC33-EN08]|uniref:MBL fold metallo-hydrolase n=1 Tax=Actinomycetospora aurantiaca TaxID=3129233 RepID=A0ABU8MVN7_9PSEU